MEAPYGVPWKADSESPKSVGKISDSVKWNVESWVEMKLIEKDSRLEEFICYIVYWCEYIWKWYQLFSEEMEADADPLGWCEKE